MTVDEVTASFDREGLGTTFRTNHHARALGRSAAARPARDPEGSRCADKGSGLHSRSHRGSHRAQRCGGNNLDALIHTVTSVDKSFNSGVIAADRSYSHVFSKPGTYAIYCLAHPFMKATVVVAPSASFTRTFAIAGSFPCHCAIHPSMKATVIVD